MPNKQYLGDGVYVETLDYGILLTTENGMYATNTIVVEPEVLAAFIRYIDAIKQESERTQP